MLVALLLIASPAAMEKSLQRKVVENPAISVRKARVELTPPELLPLGGYTARGSKLMEPGGEKLYATSTVLAGRRTPLALVSVEMLTMPESLHREVVRRLEKPVDLFLSATHTHSAPDSQMLNERMTFAIPGISSHKRKWLNWYAEKIASCVNTALESQPIVAVSPLVLGSKRLNLNRGRRPGAVPDNRLVWVQDILIPREGFELNILFASYSAHATFLSEKHMQTHGDWPGQLQNEISAPVFPGAIGDVSPVGEGQSAEQRMEDFVRKAATAIHTDRSLDLLYGDVYVVRQPISMVSPKPHPQFARDNKIPDVLAQELVGKFAPPEAAVTAFRIGKLAVVGIPGEPTSEIARSIRDAGQRLGFSHVIVVSHVNGWMGYILSPRDYDRGGYEATLSFYGREGGDRVVEAGIRALQKLRRP